MNKFKKYAIIFIVILVAALILGVTAWRLLMQNPKLRFGSSLAAVITQVQSLSNLETASYSIDKIIEAGTDYGKVGQFLFGDKLLLVANGKAVAGINLSRLSPKDFAGSGSTLSLKLPAAEIFSVSLDNSKTQVFDRDTGILSKGELNLEAEARQKAEAEILAAACEGGILVEANKNAVKQLEIIFRSAGFEKISIQSAAAANCSIKNN